MSRHYLRKLKKKSCWCAVWEIPWLEEHQLVAGYTTGDCDSWVRLFIILILNSCIHIEGASQQVAGISSGSSKDVIFSCILISHFCCIKQNVFINQSMQFWHFSGLCTSNKALPSKMTWYYTWLSRFACMHRKQLHTTLQFANYCQINPPTPKKINLFSSC